MTRPTLSVISPVYNEEAGIAQFYARLKAVLDSMGLAHEILFVDDGSRDASAQILKKIGRSDKSVRLLRFSRNFGHQLAVKAGIDHAEGDAVVTIDSDLQDPPETIAEMVREWRNGHDVVYAVRAKRDGETFFKKFTAAVFYRLLRSLSSVDLPLDAGEFRLMARPVVETIRRIEEKEPYMRGWVAWAATRPKGVLIHRQARYAGETKYSLFKMLRLAMNGFVQFSLRRPHKKRLREEGAGPARPLYVLMEEDPRSRD